MASQRLTGTITATDGTVGFTVVDVAAASVQITGTWSGTLTFKGSVDGTNFSTISGTPIAGGAAVTTTTANGTWQFNTSGLTVMQVYGTSIASGTVTVDGGIAKAGTAGVAAVAGSAPTDPVDNGVGAAQPSSKAIAVTTSGAGYVATDVVGGIISVTTVNYSTGRRVSLRTLHINDKNGNAIALNIYFFKATPTAGTYTDSSPIVFGTSDSGNKVGGLKVLAADWMTDGSQSSATYSNLDLVMPVGATTLFMLIVAQAAATFTNAGLTLNLEFSSE